MLIENASAILKKISHAAMRAGRSPDGVKLIAVTKTVEIEKIKEAVDIGLRIFGENRVQEAQKKIPALKSDVSDSGIEWHLIGHLQKNKAKYAVPLFDLIHTIDSVELAEEINRQAEKIDKIQKVLVQVKLSGEETKHGVSEEGLVPLLKRVKGMNNLNLKGLMAIPPFFEDPEKTRPYFRRLRELIETAEKAGCNLTELSMGMSNDFEVAIEEGATMVRIGTALFGERSA
ncbi:MAG TPA: YggS family pyridoxal phosphate-dependent enzyme [Dissulfurispiraceae bacterium]|nr:YggS family pyridoxal phosphate-dependent enzyme [Dissulfurispiraceae bacterium]